LTKKGLSGFFENWLLLGILTGGSGSRFRCRFRCFTGSGAGGSG